MKQPPPDVGKSDGVVQRRLQAFGRSHPTFAIRSCCLIGVLLFVILPVAGLAFAAWLYWTSIGPYTAAKAAYQNATACPSGTVQPNCFQIERVELVGFYPLPGKAGHWTDTLSLRLADGVHDVNIRYSVGDPNVAYQDETGKVRIKVYQGSITTVYGTDGKGYETSSSPQLLTYTVGIPMGMGLISGVWLVVAVMMLAILTIRSPGAIKGLWNLGEGS